MGESSGFFNAKAINGEYDRVYGAEDFADYFSNFISDGVFATPSDQLMVLAESELTIKVKKGKAYIRGYWYTMDSDTLYTVPVVLGAQPENYKVSCDLDLTERKIHVRVHANVESLLRTENSLTLATFTLNPGQSEITQAMITDRRPDKDYCGFVGQVFESIDYNNLVEQNKAQFNEWFEEMKGQLSEDAAGSLQIQIENLKLPYVPTYVGGRGKSGLVPEPPIFKEAHTDDGRVKFLSALDNAWAAINLFEGYDGVVKGGRPGLVPAANEQTVGCWLSSSGDWEKIPLNDEYTDGLVKSARDQGGSWSIFEGVPDWTPDARAFYATEKGGHRIIQDRGYYDMPYMAYGNFFVFEVRLYHVGNDISDQYKRMSNFTPYVIVPLIPVYMNTYLPQIYQSDNVGAIKQSGTYFFEQYICDTGDSSRNIPMCKVTFSYMFYGQIILNEYVSTKKDVKYGISTWNPKIEWLNGYSQESVQLDELIIYGYVMGQNSRRLYDAPNSWEDGEYYHE